MIRTLYWEQAAGDGRGATAAPAGEAGRPVAGTESRCREVAGEAARPVWESWRGGAGLLWIDLTAPERPLIDEVAALLGLHRVAAGAALAPPPRPHLTVFDHNLVLTLYAPAVLGGGVAPPARLDGVDEVVLIAGDRFLVTVHAAALPAIETVVSWCHHQPAAGALGIAGIVHQVVDEVVDRFFPLADVVVDRVEALQEFAVLGAERQGDSARRSQINALFRLKRELSSLRRVAEAQRDAVLALTRVELPYLQRNAALFRDVLDHAVRVAETVTVYHALLASAQQAFFARLSNNLAVATRTLLVITAGTMVPGLIAATYGMNFAHLPELAWPHGRTLALGLMVAADLWLLWYFRYRLRLWG